jgi:hypothetical protein
LSGRGEDEVPFVDAGPGRGPVGNDLDDTQADALAGAFRETGRERGRCTGDTEIRPAHATFGEEGGDDASGGVVDRDREADSDTGDRGVDAHDLAGRDGERTAGVAGVEGRVGLDDIVDDAHGSCCSGRQGTAQRAHDARGHTAGQSERVADRNDELTDSQVGCAAELGRGRGWSIGSNDGEIRERVGTDDAQRRGRPVGERGGARGVAAHNVCVGQEKAVVGEDHGRARARFDATVAPAARHLQGRDAGRELRGDPGDNLGIGVERVVVRLGRRPLGAGVGHGRPFLVRCPAHNTEPADVLPHRGE